LAGLRGYEIRILRSADGIHFSKVHSLPREKVPIPGFERPALLTDPQTGRFKLYGCGPWKSGPWSIIKFDDADNPAKFQPSSARAVIQPKPPRVPEGLRVLLDVEYARAGARPLRLDLYLPEKPAGPLPSVDVQVGSKCESAVIGLLNLVDQHLSCGTP